MMTDSTFSIKPLNTSLLETSYIIVNLTPFYDVAYLMTRLRKYLMIAIVVYLVATYQDWPLPKISFVLDIFGLSSSRITSTLLNCVLIIKYSPTRHKLTLVLSIMSLPLAPFINRSLTSWNVSQPRTKVTNASSP